MGQKEYDPDDITVLLDGERVVELMDFDIDEEYEGREYEDSLNDDDNILLQDKDPDISGEVEIAPTSPTINTANDLLREGAQFPLTIRFPEDDMRDSETVVGTVLTEKSQANSFDGDGLPNRQYSFIADEIQ